MLCIDEVKNLSLFKEYHEGVAKKFIDDNKSYLDEIVLNSFLNNTLLEIFWDHDGDNISAIQCPSCKKVYVNDKEKQEYSYVIDDFFACSSCGYHTLNDGDAVFNRGIYSFKNIYGNSDEDYQSIKRDNLFVVYDYVPKKVLIFGELYFSVHVDLDLYNNLLLNLSTDKEEIGEVYDAIRSLDFIIDYSYATGYLNNDISMFSISKKYGYRTYVTNFPLRNTRPSIIDQMYIARKYNDAMINLFDIEDDCVSEIVSELKEMEKVGNIGYSYRRNEADVEKPSKAMKKFLTSNQLYSSRSIFYSLSLIDYKGYRDLSRKNKDTVLVSLNKKINLSKISDIVDSIDSLNDIVTIKDVCESTSFLTNERSVKSLGMQHGGEVDFYCLSCGAKGFTKASNMFHIRSLKCDNCGKVVDYSAHSNYYSKNNKKDVNKIYQLDIVHKLSYNKFFNILYTLELDEGIFVSLIIPVFYKLDPIFIDDVEAIIKDNSRICDYISIDRIGTAHAAVLEDELSKISYFVLNNSGVDKDNAWTRVNYTEISHYTLSDIEENFSDVSVDYIYNLNELKNVLSKLKHNKYNLYDYFIENIVELNENDDRFYNYVHFFRKSLFSYMAINPSYELIIKDPAYSSIFKSIFLETDMYTKSWIEQFLEKGARRSSDAMKISGHINNILNNFKDDNELPYYTVNMIKVIRLYEDTIRLLCKDLDIEYEESLLNINGYNLIYKIVEQNNFANFIFEEVKREVIHNIGNICLQADVSINSALNYVDGLYLNQGITGIEGMKEWNDYIQMAVALDYDLSRDSILYPNSLKREHDKAVMFFNKLKEEGIDISFKSISEKYRHLEHRVDDYVFIVPKSSSEVVREGMALSHCVGSYVDNIAKGNTLIMFMRHADSIDKSYFTIEIRKNTVVQLRGMNNSSMSNKDIGALKAFKKWLKINKLKSSVI